MKFLNYPSILPNNKKESLKKEANLRKMHTPQYEFIFECICS